MNMLGHYLYLKTTSDEGQVSFSQHLVYDADRFMAAQHEIATKAGGKAKAEQITKEQYATRRS